MSVEFIWLRHRSIVSFSLLMTDREMRRKKNGQRKTIKREEKRTKRNDNIAFNKDKMLWTMATRNESETLNINANKENHFDSANEEKIAFCNLIKTHRMDFAYLKWQNTVWVCPSSKWNEYTNQTSVLRIENRNFYSSAISVESSDRFTKHK